MQNTFFYARNIRLSQSIFLVGLLLLGILNAAFSNAYAAENNIRTSASGIQYMTGGIGEDEAIAMKKIAKQFSLNLMFSEGDEGGLITDVNVVILNTEGKTVFSIKGAKPLLYVNLPSGQYRVLARYQQNKQGVMVQVNQGKNKRCILNWPLLEAI